MFGIKKVSELQKKVCNYERALGDLFLLTKDSNHIFIEYDEVLVGFLFDGIKRLHNEIATLNTALSESVKREEIAIKVIDQKRKEK